MNCELEYAMKINAQPCARPDGLVLGVDLASVGATAG